MNNRHLLLVSDFIVSGLVPFLKPELSVSVAPFNQVSLVLLDPHHACWRANRMRCSSGRGPRGSLKVLNGSCGGSRCRWLNC